MTFFFLFIVLFMESHLKVTLAYLQVCSRGGGFVRCCSDLKLNSKIFLLHFLYKYKFNKLVGEAGYFIIDFVFYRKC